MFLTVAGLCAIACTVVIYFYGSDDGEHQQYRNTYRGYVAWIYDVAYNGAAGKDNRQQKNLERNMARRGE